MLWCIQICPPLCRLSGPVSFCRIWRLDVPLSKEKTQMLIIKDNGVILIMCFHCYHDTYLWFTCAVLLIRAKCSCDKRDEFGILFLNDFSYTKVYVHMMILFEFNAKCFFFIWCFDSLKSLE